VSFVTKEVHIQFVEFLKNKVKMATEFLTLKVQSHFFSTWCYGSFKGCYPSILDDGGLWEIFQETHISVIKAQYCYPKSIEPNQTLVLEILSFMSLDL
jgi:hypothetical protein